MADQPTVKHVTMKCGIDGCKHEAFVQVLIVDDQQLQKKIDRRADDKLRAALDEAHNKGAHYE